LKVEWSSGLLAAGAGAVISIPLFFVAVAMAGGGHGTYVPATLFFPYAMLGSVATQQIQAAHMVVAALQFPAYGFYLAQAPTKQRFLVLGGVHCAVAVVTIFLNNGPFSG
jgi:hypothetical protein